MNIYTTSIKAIDPIDGKQKTFSGPHVPGISFADARNYCQQNGLGYCEVDGKLIMEIPCFKGTIKPDFNSAVDYELKNLN